MFRRSHLLSPSGRSSYRHVSDILGKKKRMTQKTLALTYLAYPNIVSYSKQKPDMYHTRWMK